MREGKLLLGQAPVDIAITAEQETRTVTFTLPGYHPAELELTHDTASPTAVALARLPVAVKPPRGAESAPKPKSAQKPRSATKRKKPQPDVSRPAPAEVPKEPRAQPVDKPKKSADGDNEPEKFSPSKALKDAENKARKFRKKVDKVADELLEEVW